MSATRWIEAVNWHQYGAEVNIESPLHMQSIYRCVLYEWVRLECVPCKRCYFVRWYTGMGVCAYVCVCKMPPLVLFRYAVYTLYCVSISTYNKHEHCISPIPAFIYFSIRFIRLLVQVFIIAEHSFYQIASIFRSD